jgi:hypothetical protein
VSGRLTEKQALDRGKIEAALGEIVSDFVVRWRDASLGDR